MCNLRLQSVFRGDSSHNLAGVNRQMIFFVENNALFVPFEGPELAVIDDLDCLAVGWQPVFRIVNCINIQSVSVCFGDLISDDVIYPE